MTARISRRTALRGLGVAVSLPWLEAMGPLTAWAAGPETKNPAPTTMNKDVAASQSFSHHFHVLFGVDERLETRSDHHVIIC